MPVRVVESSVPSQVSGPNSGHHSPQISSLLSVGQAFSGSQNVSSLQKQEAWKVNVRIQGCDLDRGYLCGTMEALNVPMADTPVVTFWEGEIVDIKNYTFFTGKWEAMPDDDIKHWTKFPSFAPFQSQVQADGGKSLDLSNYPFIFMRWKEQYFVNVGTDCGLTIAGFYYVCFSCADVTINGFYYDPNSSPFQKLELKSANEGKTGFSFSSYELHEVLLCSPTTTSPTAYCNEPSCGNVGSCKEECEQSVAMFIEKEATYMLPQPAAYLHCIARSTSLLLARRTAIQWLLKWCSRLNLSVSTVFSASNYLDRFLSMHRSLEWETWMVELVTVACLSVASKFNETNAPSLYDFQMEEMNHCFRPITIQQMELLLLQSLQWRLASITSYSYLEPLLISIADSSPSSNRIHKLGQELSATATSFLLEALLESKFVEYRPSSVAISAVWCSLQELASSNPHYSDLATRIISRLTDHSIHKDDVIRCHGLMVEMEMDYSSSSSSRSSPWSPVTVLCTDRGGGGSKDDSHVDLSIFNGNLGSRLKLGNKKKRKWEDN
ncbi:unnamed protein product [Linum tenue]|uniref:B-like cyclin n=1 Tax=Linum tenue TaxID=586396 RepID=A0AAV0PLT7_9ROSI|nr:unnamed protein product [Linum tenue]